MQHAIVTLRVRIAKITDELDTAETQRQYLVKELDDVVAQITRGREALTDLTEALAVLEPTAEALAEVATR